MNESGPEKQEAFIPFSEKNQIIKNKLDNLFKNFSGNKRELFNEISSHAIYLQKKYPDCKKYEVFYVLSFSGLSSENGSNYFISEDFPGNDSVELFIDSLITKYKV